MLEAANGEEALAVARSYSGRIDCLLTDLVMPHMGGDELATRLKPLRPRMRVLFASGYSHDPATESNANLEDTGFLPKPFQPAQLSRSVRELLDR